MFSVVALAVTTSLVIILLDMGYSQDKQNLELRKSLRLYRIAFEYLLDCVKLDIITYIALENIIRKGKRMTPIPNSLNLGESNRLNLEGLNSEQELILLSENLRIILTKEGFNINSNQYYFNKYGLLLTSKSGRYSFAIYKINNREDIHRIILAILTENITKVFLTEAHSITSNAFKPTIIKEIID